MSPDDLLEHEEFYLEIIKTSLQKCVMGDVFISCLIQLLAESFIALKIDSETAADCLKKTMDCLKEYAKYSGD